MPKACPVNEPASGKALRRNTALLIGAFHTEDDVVVAFDDTSTRHDVQLADGHARTVRVSVRFPLPGSTFEARALTQSANQLVRAHQVPTVSGNTMVIETGEASNRPRTHGQV